MRTPRSLFVLVALVALIPSQLACGGDDGGGGTAGEGVDTGGPNADNLPDSICRVSVDSFRMGLEASTPNGDLVVRIEAADYIPVRRFENAWTVSLLDAAGAPAANAILTDVVGFMPDHGHDGQVKTVITDMGNGQYQVDRINLWMDGHWEVDFSIDLAGTPAMAQFEVCVPK